MIKPVSSNRSINSPHHGIQARWQFANGFSLIQDPHSGCEVFSPIPGLIGVARQPSAGRISLSPRRSKLA